MELSTVTLTVDGYLAVRGPALLSVVDGLLEVMGYPLGGGGRIVVPVARVAIVRGRGSLVEVRCGSGAVEKLPEEEYEALFSRVKEVSEKRRVMLVGPVDVGKSTLASMILNSMATRGVQSELLTLDVGQNEVYCPGFETLAETRPPVIPGSSGSFTAISSCFVGAFSPAHALEKYEDCALSLSREAERLVVDTDGWVDEEGVRVKAEIAEKMQIDAVIAVGLDESKLREFTARGVEVVEFKPIARKSKTLEERRIHRERLLASRLAEARVVSIPLELLEFVSEKPRIKPGYGVISAAYTQDSIHPGILLRLDEKRGKASLLTTAAKTVSRVEVGVSEIDLSWIRSTIRV